MTSSKSPEEQKHLRTVVDCTRGIAFLGTPHAGSRLARWGEALRKSVGRFKETNKEILAVLNKDSETLQEVQRSFRAMIEERRKDTRQDIAITCFYEELSMPGLGYKASTSQSRDCMFFRRLND